MPARADYYVGAMPNLQLDGMGLDIGCGEGLITSQIAAKYGIGMIGLDMVTRKNTGAFLVGDATRLPFKDETFSVVTCFSAIEHMELAEKIGHLAFFEARKV